MSRREFDRGLLLQRLLDSRQVRFSLVRSGWQEIHCINGAAHAHDDRLASASVKIHEGAYNCHACGLKGDALSIVQELEGLDFKGAVAHLNAESVEISEWLFD